MMTTTTLATMGVLRIAGLCLLGAGVALGVFGYWGVYTAAGQRRFDEMDGIIPFAAGVAGLVLLAGGVVMALLGGRD